MKRGMCWYLAVVVFLPMSNLVWAQERALAYRYVEGQEMTYQRTVRLQAESAASPEGKENSVLEQVYVLRVEQVAQDGSARMTLRLDTVALREGGKLLDLPPLDTLRSISTRLTISNLGHLLEVENPNTQHAELEAFLNDIVIGITNRPALTGIVQEVGTTWKEDKEVQITHARVPVRARAAVTSRYARNEPCLGIDCSRIDYNGILTIGNARVGTMKGTLWFARATGELMREAVVREAVVYTRRQGEQIQWRINEEEVIEHIRR